MKDDWSIILQRITECYGEMLAEQVSDMIDNNMIDEVNMLLKWIDCK
jgi:hypothetical protein